MKPLFTVQLGEYLIGLAFVLMIVGVAKMGQAAPVLWSVNGHYYEAIAFPSGISWDDARTYAETLTYNGLNGHLATVTSQDENSFIVNSFGATAINGYLLGGFQPDGSPEPDGNWQWITGETWKFENWQSPAPNNEYSGAAVIDPPGDWWLIPEDVLHFWFNNGSWNDVPLTSGWGGLIVEYESNFTNRPPIVTGNTPTNDTTPTWAWTSGGGGIGTYRYKLDNDDLSTDATETTSTSYTPESSLTEGNHTLYVQEQDNSDNWSLSGNKEILIDITSPEDPIVTGITPTINTTPTWTWIPGGGGNGTYRYKLDNSDLTSGATQTTGLSYTPASALSEGSHILYVQERDSAGNWSLSGIKEIVIGTTSPIAPVQWETNGHYYEATAFPSGITWNDAKIYAENSTYLGMNGHLATITSANENSFIVNSFGVTAINGFLLGGFQPDGSPEPDGNWQWITGETWEFENWQSPAPNNEYSGSAVIDPPGDWWLIPEDVLHFWFNNGKWNDVPLTSGWGGLIIEYEPNSAIQPPIVTGNTPTNDTTPTWAWTSGGGGIGTYRYKLDNSNLSTEAIETKDMSYTPASALSEGSHILYVQEGDSVGNWSSSGKKEIIIDITPSDDPIVTGITPTRNTTPTWTWTPGGGGNGIYRYKLDNNDFTSGAIQTTGTSYTPESFLSEGSHILYVQEQDNVGNWSFSGSKEIVIDTTVPIVTILTPKDGSSINQLYTIKGNAWDVSSSISKIELLVTDGVYYITGQPGSQYWTDIESWNTAIGTDSWTLYTTIVWTPATVYTITARATDSAGNISFSSIQVTYAPGEAAYTILSLELSSQTILNNDVIDVTGKLTRLPDTSPYLAGLNINLTVTEPNGVVSTYPTVTYDSLGHYRIKDLSGFSQKGVYQVQASFKGTLLLNQSESDLKTVLVGASAGYAVLIEGKIESGEGMESHNKTVNRIYTRLKDRGFLDENIYYFNYDNQQTGVIVDELPSKNRIQYAIEEWAKGKMNGSPAPLWVIMVDHGTKGAFYLGNETITPSDLDAWLNTLEDSLYEDALVEKHIVIIGACYSGSFIPVLSWEGRVIITSAAEDEVSYKGPMEPPDEPGSDPVRSGEFFLEELFQELKRGESLKGSFIGATEKTEQFTRRGGGSANTNQFPYFDDAVQHPLLEDNDDAIGSNVLYDGQGDGYVSQDIYLGVGLNYDVNSAENPAEVLEVTETLSLDTNTSSVQLWAKSNDDSQISSLWMEIRSPLMTLTPGSSPSQLELDIPNVFMTFNETTSRWEETYDFFNDPGMYEIYYYASDVETGEISPMKRSVVYKAKADNQSPGSFNLLAPDDVGEVETMLALMWNTSTDPDSDPVTYTVEVSEDANFITVVHSIDGLRKNYYCVSKEAGLADLTTYYWRAFAVDQYGAKRYSSEIRSFKTNNTNGIPGFLIGYIFDASGLGIVSAQISSNLLSESITSLYNGLYLFQLPSGIHDITVTAQGYDTQTQSGVEIQAENYANLNVVMSLSAGGDGYLLNIGWNLISLYLQPEETDIEIILSPILDKVISVWAYADQEWQVYDPENLDFSDLETMEAGRGYWINMYENATLMLSGSTASNIVELVTGWNLVGYNSDTAQAVDAALASIVDNYISVWAYIDGQWQVYDPANPDFSDLELMEPGYGYWINAKEACAWSLP